MDAGTMAIGDGSFDVMDIEIAPSADAHLSSLDSLIEHPEAYAARWLLDMAQIGGRPRVEITAAGERRLWTYMGEDSFTRERSLRIDALGDHLKQSRHRDLVINKLIETRQCDDRRPNVSGETTHVLRAALAVGMRILISPDGSVESRSIPLDWGMVDADRDAEIVRASRAYFLLWCRFAARTHIRRAVRMCGYRTSNGWIVLENDPVGRRGQAQ